MKRFTMVATSLIASCLLSVIAPISVAQESDETTSAPSPLDNVKRISELSGRPIFAVAGQST